MDYVPDLFRDKSACCAGPNSDWDIFFDADAISMKPHCTHAALYHFKLSTTSFCSVVELALFDTHGHTVTSRGRRCLLDRAIEVNCPGRRIGKCARNVSHCFAVLFPC